MPLQPAPPFHLKRELPLLANGVDPSERRRIVAQENVLPLLKIMADIPVFLFDRARQYFNLLSWF